MATDIASSRPIGKSGLERNIGHKIIDPSDKRPTWGFLSQDEKGLYIAIHDSENKRRIHVASEYTIFYGNRRVTYYVTSLT
jgi:hypothetical protein